MGREERSAVLLILVRGEEGRSVETGAWQGRAQRRVAERGAWREGAAWSGHVRLAF